MSKDPDIKSSSKPKTDKKSVKKSKSETSPKGKPKQLTFKDKLNKFGIKHETNKKTIVRVGIGALVALFVTISVFGVLIYKYKYANRAVKIASKIIPYPVASVNGNWFWNTATYNQYLFELASYTKYAEQVGIDLKSEQGKVQLEETKKLIIKRLEDFLIINQQAKKLGINVTTKELQASYDAKIKEAGGADKAKEILDKYQGKTLADYKKDLRQQMVAEKLAEKITSDENLSLPAKKQAEDILNQVKAGADFAELAKKFSQDPGSTSNGGDLGLISKGQTVPEFEAAAFALEPGQTSGIVKTKFGYHIIKVTGKEGDQVRVSHILIKGADLESWLKDQRAKAKIVQYFNP